MFGFEFGVADPVVETPGWTPDAATAALVTRMSVAPAADRARVIDTLVTGLKSAGVWAKLDVLQLFAAHDSQAALLNWQGPTFTASIGGGAPVFVPNRGFFCNGIADVIDLGCAPSGLSQFAQNNAEFGGWMRTPSGAARANSILGTQTASACTLNPRAASNVVGARINGATADTSVASSDFYGMTSVARIGSGQIVAARGGVRGTPQSAASAARSSVNLGFGKCNNAFAEGQICAFFAGAALSDAEETALFAALSVYMAAVGVAALTPATRTLTSTSVVTLPDGAAPVSVTKGMACTGLARRADGKWYVGNGIASAQAICFSRLSADFTSVEAQFTVVGLGLGSPPGNGSVQGLCVDAFNPNLMWAVLKIGNGGANTYLFSFDMVTETVAHAPVALPTLSCNGVADDGVADTLLISQDISSSVGGLIRVSKTTGANVGALAQQTPGDTDMMAYLASDQGANLKAGDLLVTAGVNGAAGTISVMRRDDYGGYCTRRIDTLTGSTAIEGVVVSDGVYHVCNDGATHPDAIGTNRIMTYAS